MGKSFDEIEKEYLAKYNSQKNVSNKSPLTNNATKKTGQMETSAFKSNNGNSLLRDAAYAISMPVKSVNNVVGAVVGDDGLSVKLGLNKPITQSWKDKQNQYNAGVDKNYQYDNSIITTNSIYDADREKVDKINKALGNAFSYDSYKSMPYDKLNYLNDDEKRTVAYYAQKGDYDSALDYIDSLRDITAESRENLLAENQRVSDYLDNSGVVGKLVGDVYDMGTGLAGFYGSGLGTIATLKQIAYNMRNDVNDTVDENSAFFNAAAVNAQANENLLKDKKGIGKLATQIVQQSLQQYIPTMLLGYGAVPALFGLSSAGSSAYENAQNGTDAVTGMVDSVVKGIISYQSENLLSADKLFGLTGNSSPFLELSKESFKGLAKAMAGEAFEEAEEAVLDSVWEQAWVGNKSAISKEIGEYIAQGYSKEEANKMAWSNFAKETGESMLIAGLSAAVDTAATGTAGNIRVNRMMQNQSAREQTVLNAAELNTDSEAYQNADRLSSQDNISVKDVVKQYKLNWKENQAEWDTNLKDRYSEINNGILNEKSVETLKKALDGEKLSNKEAEMILKDNAAKELYQQYTDTDLDNIGTFAQQRRAIKNYSNNIVVNAEVGNAQTRVMNADTNALSSLTGEAKTIADNLTNKGQTNGAKALAYVLSKNSSKDADKVASEFDYLYKQGFTGNSRINMLSNGVLDNAAAYVAFSAGINDNRLNLKNTQVVNKGNGGYIDTGAKVNDTIKKRMDVVGRKSGVKFRVEDNLTDFNGKRVNGYYDSGNNTIVISSDANIAQVAAHEWVHRLRKTSASSYKSLADNVMNTINTVPHLKKHYDEYLKRYNNDGLDNTAYFEEMVAEFTGDLYGIETVADMFGDVPTTTLGRIKKQLRNVISDFTRASSATDIAGLAKIDRAMGIAINRQSEIVNDWSNAKTLDKPIEVTAKNTNNNNVDSIAISAVNDDDKNTYSRLSYNDAKLRGMYDDLVKKGVLTKEESDRLMNAVDNAYKYMENFLDEDGNVLMSIDLNESVTRENRPFRVFKNNSDPLYIYSLDFSTLCKKRLMAQAVIESLQKKLTDSNGKHKALSSKEQMAIRKAMIHWQAVDANIEVACGLCFVEAARLKAPAQINNFLNNREQYINKYFAKKDKGFEDNIKQKRVDMLKEMGYPAKTLTLEKYKNISESERHEILNTPLEKLTYAMMSTADKNAIVDMNNEQRVNYGRKGLMSDTQKELMDELLSIPDEMFLTAEGLARIKTGDNGKLKYGGEIYSLFSNAIASATRSKAQEIDMPYYYGDADEITQALIDKMNAESGLRTQSWSDFTTTHMLDYIIAISELSMKGAKMQAYTKVPNFVHFMGETGVMINLSLIPKGQSGFDANGNLVFSNTEGMPFNTALELRSQHKNTTGTISIGISDEQIVALLNDDRIDYVIPYHASGLNADLKKLADINQWKDYTKLQHDKQGNSMYDISFSEWFNNITYTDKNGNTRMNTPEELSEMGYSGKEIMKMAQDNFLRICNENGVTPRFSQFLTKENGQWKIDSGKTENYWKLLIDRKMIDDLESKNNKVIIQQAVRPNFDESVMKKIIRETAETDSTETVKRITRAIEQDYLNKANGGESIIDKIIKRDTALKKTDKAYADKYKALTAEINNGLDALYDMPKIASKRDVYNLASPEKMAASFSFSRTDSAGNSLTEQQQEYFKDSKVRDESGALMVVYHQTDADFTQFRTKSTGAGRYDHQMPDGIFTKPADNDIGLKGKKQMALYANITNPLMFDNRRQAEKFWKDNIDGYDEAVRQLALLDIEYHEKYEAADLLNDEMYKTLLQQLIDKQITREEFSAGLEKTETKKILKEWEEKGNQLRAQAKQLINDYVAASDYDGLIMENDQGSFGRRVKSIVAFSSEQLKSVSNKNPTDNPDIRYSKKDSAGNSLTAEQIKYFADSKIRDEDGNLLVVYHGTDAEFTEFKTDYRGAIWTSDKKLTASRFDKSGSGKTMKLYANIKNPLVKEFTLGDNWDIDATVEEIKAGGYDGAIINFKADGNNHYLNFMVNKYPDTPADDYLSSVGGHAGSAESGETISQYMQRALISSHKYIVAMNSSQLKSVSNKNPTDNPDIRFSKKTDERYLELAKNPETNEAELQKMVDEYAKAKGYTVKAYHGTDSFGFTRFDSRNSDDRVSLFFTDSVSIAGSYSASTKVKQIGKPYVDNAETIRQAEELIERFKDSDIDGDIYKSGNKYIIEDFSEYGGKVVCKTAAEFVEKVNALLEGDKVGSGIYGTYLKMNNPLVVDVNGKWDEIDFVPPEAKELREKHIEANNNLYAKIKEVKAYAKEHDMPQSEAEYYVKGYAKAFDASIEAEEKYNEFLEENGLSEEVNTRRISNYAHKNGYDGVIFNRIIDIGTYGADESFSTVYVVFDSNQVKSADPVTYDDKGNIIPLEERFNTKNPDIRYSRTGDSRGKITDNNELKYSKLPAYEERLLNGELFRGKSEKAVYEYTKDILAKMSSNLKADETAEKIQKLYDDMQRSLETDKKFGVTVINNYEAYQNRAQELAKEIVDSAVDITEDQNRMLKDEIAEYFRTTRLDTSSIQAADLGVDSKSEILRKYFGNFRFKKSSAGHSVHTVDTMYRELNGMYRGIFPDDIINSAEQFNRFIEVMDWIKTDESFEEKLFNEKDEDYELVVENVANSILGNYWLTADAPLKTDMQKYVNKLKNEIERLKEEVNAAKTRTDKDKLLRDWLRAKDFNEGKSRANAKWEKKNVKAMEKIESLESVVDDLIFQIYAGQETLAKTIETHKNLNKILDIATTFKQWGKGVRSASELNDPVLTEYARQLGKIKYRSDIRKASSRGIIATLDPFYKQSILGNYYSDEIRTRIDFILANKESTKPLSSEEIQAISDIMQGIKHLYQTYDKMVMNGKRVGIREVAKAESDILDKSTYSETRIKLFNMLSNKLNTRVGYDASKAVNAVLNEVVEPRVVFGTVESFDENGILMKAFNDITKGETEMNRLNIEMLREANDFIKEHKGYGARLKNKTIVFEGRTISVGQAITLYMTMQRQQAWRSLTGSHVGAGAWIKDAKSGKYSHLVWTKRNASVEEQRQVMKDVSDVLYNTLSEEDRQFITIAQNLFDGMSKELKRETDMKILGFTNIEEESGYIPISRKGTQIAKAYADTNSMLKDVTSAYNYSFNKDLKKNVQLGLEILDIYDLMKSHSRKMSMYAALTNPLQNLDKILNCNLAYDDEGNKVGVYNIRERLNEMWSGWDKYYSNLITDIQNKGNGGQSVIVNKVRSAFANAQLGFNPKVVLTQFASYPTAMIYLDADSLAKGVGMKTDFDALDKYSGYAMARAYEDGVVQSEGLIDTWGKITQFTTKGISFMDRQTIGKLWNACQVEVEAKDNLKIGTEENYKAAAELLEKVCRATQPNYSNSERSGLMRNKNAIISSFTMFTSVPLKQLSRTVESATKLSLLNDVYKNNPSAENKQKLDNAKKEAARVQASIFLANAMYVLMAMGVKWLLPKKKEDEEITTAKFATGMFETYIGMMPLAKDLYNYFVNGYDFNNFFYSSVTDALGAVKNFTSDFADDPVHATVDFTSVIAQMFGMPIRNAQNVYKGVMNRVFVTQGGELGYKALKTTKSVTSSYYRDDYLELISNTLLKGDVETAKTIIDDMVKSGVNKSTISSSMKTYLAKKIYKAWKENDEKTFNDVSKILKALGWSQKTIESQIITQMKKEIVTDDKDFQRLLRLVKNYRAGKSRYTREELLEMIDELITKWTDKGYNRSTVESIFRSALK